MSIELLDELMNGWVGSRHRGVVVLGAGGRLGLGKEAIWWPPVSEETVVIGRLGTANCSSCLKIFIFQKTVCTIELKINVYKLLNSVRISFVEQPYQLYFKIGYKLFFAVCTLWFNENLQDSVLYFVSFVKRVGRIWSSEIFYRYCHHCEGYIF